MITSPPLPPSPPDGPPRGTTFSRRKATKPLPPSPAFTRILASSMNISRQPSSRTSTRTNHVGTAALGCPAERSSAQVRPRKSPGPRRGSGPREEALCGPCIHLVDVLLRFQRLDHHELAHGALVHELDAAADLGKKSVVLTSADVEPRLHPRAALPHDDGAARDNLSTKSLKAQALRIGVATVASTAYPFFM